MAFASFSTRAQIRMPRQFTARLPDLLLAGDRRPIV
jgi:hypothetical protein